MATTISAPPYTARQCPECKVWVYVDLAPFGEDDPTKSLRDCFHWEREHATDDEKGAAVFGFPFFTYNDATVEAVIEDLDTDSRGV